MENEMHPGRVSEELRERAKKAHLAECLLRMGVPLVRSGTRYRHPEHNSLVFNDNRYFWNSRQGSDEKKDYTGDALEYLTWHMKIDYRKAVALLTLEEPGRMDQRAMSGRVGESARTEGEFSFSSIKMAADTKRAEAYLSKHRGLDYKFVKELIGDKRIYQEAAHNNILFPMYDENNVVVGAEVRGTLTDKVFKGVLPGSKYGYGYSIQGQGDAKMVLFFEGAIDLLSFMEIQRLKNTALDKVLLVSMVGLKEAVIKHTLERSDRAITPVLSVDNDSAGVNFIKRVKGQIEGVKTHLPPQPYKDWNDLLKAMKKHAN
jgi:hypothetical protein